MKVLTLFSGTGSVSRALELFPNAEEVTLDWKEDADIMEDILEWDYTIFKPGSFDVIWGSPDCVQYSRARVAAKTPRDLEWADSLVIRLMEIIDYLQPTVYFIENPSTGLLPKRHFMLLRPFTEVHYCQYGSLIRKSTAIWSNIKLDLLRCEAGNRCALFINGRHCFHLEDTPSGRGRGAIPVSLLESIFQQALVVIDNSNHVNK